MILSEQTEAEWASKLTRATSEHLISSLFTSALEIGVLHMRALVHVSVSVAVVMAPPPEPEVKQK